MVKNRIGLVRRLNHGNPASWCAACASAAIWPERGSMGGLLLSLGGGLFGCGIGLVSGILRGAAFGGRSSFDFDFGAVRQGVSADGDDRIAFLETGLNFGELLAADTDLDLYEVSFAVGTGEQDIVTRFRVFVDGRDRHNKGVLDALRDGFDRNIHAGLQRPTRLDRFDPHFNGGTSRIKCWADEHNAAFNWVVQAFETEPGRIADLELDGFVLCNVRFGDEL